MPRSTGGTWTRYPVTPGTGGATTTRRRAFPYTDLVAENGRRSKFEPEYELLDTGVFDEDRYWITEVWYAKGDDPTDVLMTIEVTNAGPEADTLHVLPTAWFRNTWSWDQDAPKPTMAATSGSTVAIEHPFLGDMELLAGPAPDGAPPQLLFCENETNAARLFDSASSTPYPKDGVNDHVIHGADTVNPDRTGTKCAFWYRVSVRAWADGAAAAAPAAEAGRRARPEERSAAVGSDFERVDAAASRRS